jgi:hydrogenase 3 maturation protease
MSTLSWQNSLRTKLAKHPRPRVAILGIGNELRGDDAAGVIVARELQSIVGASLALAPGDRHAARSMRHLRGSPLHIIDAGAVPEAFTGQLRRFDPDLVIMIDAAQMDQPPGTIRLIEWQDTLGLSASTHSLPLNVIAQYLISELKCEVILIGLQPEANDFDTPLSPAMRCAVDELIGELRSIGVEA